MSPLRLMGCRSSQKKFQRYRPKIDVQGKIFVFDPIYKGKRAKISPKINKIEIWLKLGPKVINSPNQNSKTTFIVQTFPKYGPYGFDLVNLSLLGPILAKFQFCWFSAYFGPFSLVNGVKHENLSPNVNFWSITLNFFLWTHTTHEHAWLKGCSSIKKSEKWDTLMPIAHNL